MQQTSMKQIYQSQDRGEIQSRDCLGLLAYSIILMIACLHELDWEMQYVSGNTIYGIFNLAAF